MRILQVAPPWFAVPPASYGGIEWIVALLADGLTDAGNDVTLLASGGSQTRATLRSVYDVAPSASLGDPNVELVHVLAAHLARTDHDIIHDHTAIGTAVGAAVHAAAVRSSAGATPIVHTLHGPWTEAAANLYELLGEHVSLVAISHDQAARAPSDVQIAAVVHNGLRLQEYPAGRGDGGHLAWVGRASPEKGPLVAIEAAQRLGLPLRMAIKVNEADERAYWDQAISPRLEDAADIDVIIGADHRQKVELLGGAMVALVPIQWPEPFGLVMIEANACATPVVANACGAAPEIIRDGVSGFLVEPGDIDGFCEAVESASRLPRSPCRTHVVDNFSAEQMVDGYLRVYDEVLAGRASRPMARP